eukprot:scaffold1669_cov129-Cylindrotheca_fusiformis.AAC.51
MSTSNGHTPDLFSACVRATDTPRCPLVYSIQRLRKGTGPDQEHGPQTLMTVMPLTHPSFSQQLTEVKTTQEHTWPPPQMTSTPCV